MIIIRSSAFDKKLAKLPLKIYNAYAARIRLFARDPYHPLLNNHSLTGANRRYRSINITGDWRLIYEPVGTIAVRLMRIGTHADLYE